MKTRALPERTPTPGLVPQLYHPKSRQRHSGWPLGGTLALLFCLLLAATGCGKSKIDKGLESDANGYACMACNAKFYTAREVFPTYCPQCKQKNIQLVMAVKCPDDQHVTLFPRSRGARGCEKCGKPIAAIFIPGEAELKTWGAAKKTAAEVGG